MYAYTRVPANMAKLAGIGFRQVQIPVSFTAASVTWRAAFNKSSREQTIHVGHPSIAAYAKDAVFSVSGWFATGGGKFNRHYTADGRDAIQKQWDTIRNRFNCRRIIPKSAEAHKVEMLDDRTIIQSFDNLTFEGKTGTPSLSFRMYKVWQLFDDKWMIMSDYVVVKDPEVPFMSTERTSIPTGFTEQAGAWIAAFNKASNDETIAVDHPSISAYAEKAVFSVSGWFEAGGNRHYTADGRDAIQKQWNSIRNHFDCRRIIPESVEGHKVVRLDCRTIVQSFDNITFEGKDGTPSLSVQISCEVWQNFDGKWMVMSDYVVVKDPTAPREFVSAMEI